MTRPTMSVLELVLAMSLVVLVAVYPMPAWALVAVCAAVVFSWPISGWSPAQVVVEALWRAASMRVIRYARTRPCVRIYERGDLYLERYYILGRRASERLPEGCERLRWLPTVWVHHFVRPDAGRAQHNHPWWWALSVILRGGYTEERGRVARRVTRVNFITRGTFHRVAQLHGRTWTLFITGAYAGTWGFIVGGKVVPWRDYVRERDEQATPTDRS